MRKKPSTRSKYDLIVTLICLLGIAGSLWLFWSDLNRVLTRLSETPVGTISFKYKSAQRRFIDRVIWDRIRQQGPVYNGDIIRTADLAEATITFTSGQSIDLLGSCLIQVFYTEAGASVNFSSGRISADAHGQQITLNAGGTAVETEGTAGLAGDGRSLDILAAEGGALVHRAGKTITLEAGSALTLLEDGSISAGPLTAVISPRPNLRLLTPSQEALPVYFTWRPLNFTPRMYAGIDIARDSKFTRSVSSLDVSGAAILPTGAFEAAAALPPGVFWWRVYPKTKDGPLLENAVEGKISILHAPPPRRIAPGEGAVYTYRTRLPAVHFRWTLPEAASFCILEAADNPGMINPRLVQRAGGSSFVYEGFDPGVWFWRITPVYPGFEGPVSASGTGVFTVEQEDSLPAPVLTAPPNGGSVSISPEKKRIYFSWKNENEAETYTVRIAGNPELQDPVIVKTVRENWYTYDTGGDILKEGRYFWGVLQTGAGEHDSPVSEIRSFYAADRNITRRAPPPDNHAAAVPSPAPEPLSAAPSLPAPEAVHPPSGGRPDVPEVPPEIPAALFPRIDAFTPDHLYLDEDTRTVALRGRHLLRDSEILLKPRSGIPAITPLDIDIEAGGEGALLVFGEADLRRGLRRLNRYDIYIRNPGGLWSSKGPFKVALSKPCDLLVSLGYAPPFFLAGDTRRDRPYPMGLDARFALVPLKWRFGYAGAELTSFWNTVTFDDTAAQIAGAHINGLYQKYLNRTMALNIRFGGGITSLLNLAVSNTETWNTWFFSMGAGASFQWFLYRGFFVEAGVDYRRLFSRALPTGLLLPRVNAGWRF
jgi:hypothetical protein